ncbi:hypothetical protein FB451DRAFT_1402779 [Mycena latifolia]|nr:hypothetical protein FB451DRAFT_1402779 [Mycena latifolia]
MFLSKIMAPVMLALALASSAQGCLHIYGSAEANAFSSDVGFTAVDNGVQTCQFDGGGDGYATCINGYRLHFNYKDNPESGPLPMTYSNPSNTYEIRVGLSCTFSVGCCRTCRFSWLLIRVLNASV